MLLAPRPSLIRPFRSHAGSLVLSVSPLIIIVPSRSKTQIPTDKRNMASQVPAQASLDLHDTFGAAFIGALISMVLYGITTLQTYLYYMYYPKDGGSLKVTVASLWVLDTLQVGLVGHTIYYYLITNYANPAVLAAGAWSLFMSILVNLIISTIAQSFFAIRVQKLSSDKWWRWWLTALIAISILAHIAFGLETVIRMMILEEFSKLPEITLVAALPFAITAVIPDVLITISLCYFLQNVKGGYKGTNALLNTLIIYAINRCLLTSLVAIVEVVVFWVLPRTFYFIAVDFCIGKLYANSLLASLNSRQSLRGRGYESDSLSLSTPSSRSVPTPQFGLGSGIRARHGRPNDSHELTDLRATWPSGVETVDSEPGVRPHHLHRSHRSADKDETLDIRVTTHLSTDAALQEVETERESSQKHVPV